MTRLVLAACLLLPVAIADAQPASRPFEPEARTFSHEGVTVLAPAEIGRLDAFEPVAGEADTYRCTIRTWETGLVNGGPQFHFVLTAATARQVHLRFGFLTGEDEPWRGRVPYYLLRREGMPFQRLAMPPEQTLTLAVDTAGVTVCRSAPFSLTDLTARLAVWSRVAGVRVEDIGRSADGRPVQRIVFGGEARTNPPTVWILSRQHPAEPSGQHVAAALIDALLSDEPAMRGLRQRVRFSCVPLVNPDGVARLLWRGNAAGADLNRDWMTARQPEVRALHGAIEADLKAGLSPAAMIDLHSTYSTYWYVPLAGTLSGEAGEFLPALVAKANGRMGEGFSAPLHPVYGTQIGSTSGAYFVGRFAIPAATMEMAYHALPQESAAYGRAIAHAMAEVPVPAPRAASRPAEVPAARP